MSAVRRLPVLLGLLAGLVTGGASAARAQEAAPPPAVPQETAPPPRSDVLPYIRAREGENGVLTLELATRTFAPRSGTGPLVRLVSAVHIADGPFYADAQERLDAHDLVLFEGIRPAGTGRLPAGAGDGERAAATRHRLELLGALAQRGRGEGGAFPADLAAFREAVDPRWKGLLPELLEDGWGRAIRYSVRPAETGPDAAPAGVVFASDGPDGRPDVAGDGAEPGDDIVVTALDEGGMEDLTWSLYDRFAAVLGLKNQSDAVDTSRPHWRSSDMALDELQRRVAAAGGDLSRMIGFFEGTTAEGRMVKAVIAAMDGNPRMAAWMKLVMVEGITAGAETKGGSTGPGAAILGPNAEAVWKVVIEDRNTVVLEDLRAVLSAKPVPGSVAVFYGAGHMDDMERRLVRDFGYEPGETTWSPALTADPAAAGLTPEQSRAMRAAMRKMMEGASGKR